MNLTAVVVQDWPRRLSLSLHSILSGDIHIDSEGWWKGWGVVKRREGETRETTYIDKYQENINKNAQGIQIQTWKSNDLEWSRLIYACAPSSSQPYL